MIQSVLARPYRRVSEGMGKQKLHISALYVDQDRPLEEVTEMMKFNHGQRIALHIDVFRQLHACKILSNVAGSGYR